ncbi:hypothetical protein DRO66_08795 [Candidatus Bathyarchaeota archaeon]|nr:MAG: hypothetical protein DRO66_08795 [Candidatus Bathyarchaeota archaeon]
MRNRGVCSAHVNPTFVLSLHKERTKRLSTTGGVVQAFDEGDSQFMFNSLEADFMRNFRIWVGTRALALYMLVFHLLS